MRNPRLERLTDYPFRRLAALLEGVAPGGEPLVLSIGEPRRAPPAFVAAELAANADGWGRYPPLAGTGALRAAIAAWLRRRYRLPDSMLDADRHVLPLAGTREGLFQAALLCCGDGAGRGRPPVVLLPNPFYQVYAGAAVMAGAEPVFVPATAATGFLPDFAALAPEVLERTALAYLCSPANPQGAVAEAERLRAAVTLARRHDFVLAADECYSEIYDAAPPPGALAACAALGGGLDNVLVFNSLSKRSGAPGLRSGFVAGDPGLIAAFQRLRAYGGAAVPLPVQAASAALWADEAHVEAGRAHYRAAIDAAEAVLAGRFGFRRPPGGFFLWLAVGDGESAAHRLWAEAGLKVLPGAYLAREGPDGVNPGAAYIRVALVDDAATITRAMTRLVRVLGD